MDSTRVISPPTSARFNENRRSECCFTNCLEQRKQAPSSPRLPAPFTPQHDSLCCPEGTTGQTHMGMHTWRAGDAPRDATCAARRDTLAKSGSTERLAPLWRGRSLSREDSLEGTAKVQQSVVHLRDVREFRMDKEHSKRSNGQPTWPEKWAGSG